MKLILCFCIISFFTGIFLIFIPIPNYDQSRINTKTIRTIKPGMTELEVITILGFPVKKYDSYHKGEFSYVFTEEKFPFTYPMLWLHFDKDNRVYSVYAKEYFLIDDLTIYSLSCKYEAKNGDYIYYYNQYYPFENSRFSELF